MFVIAEAGVNHNGSWGLAEEIIKQAKLAGADAVKWQTYKAEDLVTKTAPRFWNWEGDDPGSQYDSYKKLESFANENACRVLADICRRYGIEYMTTPFSLEAVRWNSSLVKRWKIASGDITNKQLIDAVADTGKQILLSTGGTALNEINEALSWIGTRARVVVMHCNLKYPTEDGDVNLGALMDLRRMYGCALGYSDHSLGQVACVGAAVMGADYVEKHFTVAKTLPLSADHWLSADPAELKQIVDGCRAAENMRGWEDSVYLGKKFVSSGELPARTNARRSVVFVKPVEKGEVITKSHVALKRPGTGVAPKYLDEVCGLVASRAFDADETLFHDEFEQLREARLEAQRSYLY